MADAFICDAVRTPIGRYGGALAAVRTDDLAAVPIVALLRRNPSLDPAAIEEGLLGCANQAGEGNRKVARMASPPAGPPGSGPGGAMHPLWRGRPGPLWGCEAGGAPRPLPRAASMRRSSCGSRPRELRASPSP